MDTEPRLISFDKERIDAKLEEWREFPEETWGYVIAKLHDDLTEVGHEDLAYRYSVSALEAMDRSFEEVITDWFG